MWLEPNDFLYDIKCPHCGAGLDVEIDHMDEWHPIDSVATCPCCRKEVSVRSSIEFTASEVQHATQ